MEFLKPLYGRQQRLLFRISFVLCIGSLLLMPIAAPTSTDAEASTSSLVSHHPRPSLPGALDFPAVVVTHDPFLPAVDAFPQAALAAGDDDDTGIILPPNTAISAESPADGEPVVRAVVLGTIPKALLEIGGRSDVVGIGSSVAGSTITAIDRAGVHLVGGQIIRFVERRP